MGYLNNSTVTVDAILTLKGRELLAKGSDAFNVTQFAVGDDEVDYSLWNPDHPLGTNFYGTIIENMPITEAIPDETQALKYKLVTLPKQTTNMPVVSVGNSSITLSGGESTIISPNTTNIKGGNANLGYTFILGNSSIARLDVQRPLQNSSLPTTPRFIGDNEDAQTFAVTGFSVRVVAKDLLQRDENTTITIIGNETGGSVTVNLIVKKITASQALSAS
tara:strand:- start:9122 stop:9781 length:660 start_codon:yes stop_codon:yes gene_type:complete